MYHVILKSDRIGNKMTYQELLEENSMLKERIRELACELSNRMIDKKKNTGRTFGVYKNYGEEWFSQEKILDE